jgi:hypothetical protein
MERCDTLTVAKTQLQRKMYIEAIASFNDIMSRDADEAGEAAYCLGIIY